MLNRSKNGHVFTLYKTDYAVKINNKFPKWEKAKYYSSSYTIYNCKTGRISPELKTGRELGKQPKCVKDNIVSKETYDGGTTANLIYGAKAAMKVKEKVIGIWGLFKDWLRLCFR